MILFVTGARPNFIKVKPLIDKCAEWGIPHLIYNSNQHDAQMQVFEMGAIRDKLFSFDTRVQRFSCIMNDFSNFLAASKPSVVVVTGDTDTSLACALCADMKGIPVAHVEAGLRSYYKMPEETNRIAIDTLSTYNFAPTLEAHTCLTNLKLPSTHVGNIMVESLIKNYLNKSEPVWFPKGETFRDYILVELHRQENDIYVTEVMRILDEIKSKVVWVKHPRYKYENMQNIRFLDPQSYYNMCYLVRNANLLITDSGGLQVDSTFLGTPCITLRKSTEWQSTIHHGTNHLVSIKDFIGEAKLNAEDYVGKKTNKEVFKRELWDDKVSERILNVLKEV
jgi:UDP-N-acetylglucosamine 2-epimerase (non-hydrolysing)